MKIQLLSDLHTEFMDYDEAMLLFEQIKTNADILVLAGDIGNPNIPNYQLFLSAVSNHYPKVFLVAGNHEYYGGTIDDTNEKIHQLCTSFPNVTFLNNSMEVYAGHCWIGTTLWTDVDPSTRHLINDCHRIEGADMHTFRSLHSGARSFLEATLTDCPTPCIVITHHLPSFQLIDDRYKNDPYNIWFASNLDDVLHKHQDRITYWFYGHTHLPKDAILHNVHMVCHPLGYEHEWTPSMCYHKILDLS